MLAIAGAAMGLVIVLSTFLPGAPYVPEAVSFVPFVLVFSLFGWAVIERATSAQRKPRQKWNQNPDMTNADYNRAWAALGQSVHRYRVVLAIAVPVVILLWATMMISITSLQGQPIHAGNVYFLDDHGSHIPVSQASYEAAVAQEERIFPAGGTIFLIVAAFMSGLFDPDRTEKSTSKRSIAG